MILFFIFCGVLLILIGIMIVLIACKINAITTKGELIIQLHEQTLNK